MLCPSITGIYEQPYSVEFQVKDAKGQPTGTTKKTDIMRKTLYNPNVISNEKIVKWGREAMDEAVKSYNDKFEAMEFKGTAQIEGHAKNGLKYVGFYDPQTGIVTNFYPVLNKKGE